MFVLQRCKNIKMTRNIDLLLMYNFEFHGRFFTVLQNNDLPIFLFQDNVGFFCTQKKEHFLKGCFAALQQLIACMLRIVYAKLTPQLKHHQHGLV